MNQKALRTLLWWTIWTATSIVVYASLYHGSEIWVFIEQDRSHITWLIIGLFIIGFLTSFFLSIRITFESLDLNRFETLVRKSSLREINKVHGKSAVGRFFCAIKETMEANGDPDIDALLHVEMGFYQRTSHSIETIGNLLITLGLIGTVMGLTLTLTGLTGSLEALGHDQELLLAGLRKAMAGMGTAFYTTLLGAVLGGVLLRVFAQITEHGVQSLHDELTKICLIHCSGDYRPSLERDVRLLNSEIQLLESNVKILHDSLKQSSNYISSYRDEIQNLGKKADIDNEGDLLRDRIDLHRKLTDILKKEIYLLNKINRPWYIRLRNIFWRD